MVCAQPCTAALEDATWRRGCLSAPGSQQRPSQEAGRAGQEYHRGPWHWHCNLRAWQVPTLSGPHRPPPVGGPDTGRSPNPSSSKGPLTGSPHRHHGTRSPEWACTHSVSMKGGPWTQRPSGRRRETAQRQDGRWLQRGAISRDGQGLMRTPRPEGTGRTRPRAVRLPAPGTGYTSADGSRPVCGILGHDCTASRPVAGRMERSQAC